MSKNLLNLLLVVATVAVYLMAIKPLYTGQGGIVQPEQSVKDLMTLNKQHDEALEKAESAMSQADSLKAKYERVSDEDKAKMAIMVPDKIDKVRLLSEVLNVAQDAGFFLSDLSYSEGGNASGGKSAVTVSFSVKTTYERFKALINNFEKSMRLYSVDSVSFTSPEKEGDMITFQVKLQTYYLK